VGQGPGENGKADIDRMSHSVLDLFGAGRSHIEVVVAHAATSTFINLVQDLLQGLHGCVPTHHTANTISNACQPLVRSRYCYYTV